MQLWVGSRRAVVYYNNSNLSKSLAQSIVVELSGMPLYDSYYIVEVTYKIVLFED